MYRKLTLSVELIHSGWFCNVSSTNFESPDEMAESRAVESIEP